MLKSICWIANFPFEAFGRWLWDEMGGGVILSEKWESVEADRRQPKYSWVSYEWYIKKRRQASKQTKNNVDVNKKKKKDEQKTRGEHLVPLSSTWCKARTILLCFTLIISHCFSNKNWIIHVPLEASLDWPFLRNFVLWTWYFLSYTYRKGTAAWVSTFISIPHIEFFNLIIPLKMDKKLYKRKLNFNENILRYRGRDGDLGF